MKSVAASAVFSIFCTNEERSSGNNHVVIATISQPRAAVITGIEGRWFPFVAVFLDTMRVHQHRFSLSITRRFSRRRVSAAWSVFSSTCTRTCCSSFVRQFRYHVPPSPSPLVLRIVGNTLVTANFYQLTESFV